MASVLHINTENSWRGGENQLKYLLNGLSKLGVKNHLLVREGSVAHDRFKSLGLLTPISMNLLSQFKAAKWLARYCVNHGVDVVAAHNGFGHNVGILASALNPRIKLVVHRRIDNELSKTPYHRYKYRCERVHKYITVSKKISKILCDYGVSSTKVSHVYSGVELNGHKNMSRMDLKKKFSKKYDLDPGLNWIGNASALTLEKGHEELLTSFLKLKKQGVKFHGLIAGQGYMRERLKEFIRINDLNKEVRLLGFLNEPQSFIQALDLLVVPSRNEGLGSVLLEGIAANCSIIGSRAGGIPEIINHGENGFLVEINSPEDIAKHIKLSFDHPDHAEKMRKAALSNLHEKFLAESMVQKTHAIYQDVIGSDEMNNY